MRWPSFMTLALLMSLAIQSWAAADTKAPVPEADKKNDTDGGFLDTISDAIEDVMEDAMDDIKEAGEAVVQGVNTLVENIKDGAEVVVDTVQDAIEDVGEALGIIAVDEVETKVERFLSQTALVRNVLGQGAIGAAMMFWGTHFSQTIIMAHTIRVTGWPLLRAAFNDLVFFYRKAREAIRKEFPNLKKARDILDAVRFEAATLHKISEQARVQRQHGKISKKEAAAIIRQAEVDLRQLHKKSYVLNQAVSSVSAITGAIDMSKLKDIVKGVYTSILACLAAGSSATVRTLSVGFDLAGIIGKHLDHLFHKLVHENNIEIFRALPTEAQKLLGLCVSLLSIVKGLLLVKFVVPKMSLSISSSALGAAWVSNALVEVSDVRAGGKGKGLLTDGTLYMLTHVALTLMGVIFQAHHPEELPAWVQKILWPAVNAEAFLRKWEMGGKKAKASAAADASAPAS